VEATATAEPAAAVEATAAMTAAVTTATVCRARGLTTEKDQGKGEEDLNSLGSDCHDSLRSRDAAR
jgi:hypothetical protein